MIYQDIEKHLLSVDCVIFGYHENDLKLLLFERTIKPHKGNLSLLGGWVEKNESVEDAAQRVLTKLTGLPNIIMEQVGVFSNPQRDPGGRVVSIVFYALINIEQYGEPNSDFGAQWISINEIPQLIFDHNQMIDAAKQKLKQKASYTLVGQGLLPDRFTITQLRSLYNAIYSTAFDPGNFRKKIISLKALNRLNEKETNESKKGAFLYQFKPEEDINITERIVSHKIMDQHE
jgi:ADP-ribose pyrophosphatase YjhB (NUDIX family)